MTHALTHLSDVFDVALLDEMVSSGYVRTNAHPDLPLRILNYTEAAQYERVWNDVTIACRGLIVDANDRVVARPFGKFFNHGERDAAAGHGPVVTTDKLDGSLGILYHDRSALRIATRGSFHSEQALHASDVLAERYAAFTPRVGWTYLFEIVFPENRIVVDYGSLDDLVLLGAVDIASGRSVPLPLAAATWPGPVVDVLPFDSLADAVSAPPRANREGMVVHFVEPDVRVKVKYDEYVRLHRIVTGMSTTAIYDHLRAGRSVSELIADVPDEMYPAVAACVAELTGQFTTLRTAIDDHYAAIVADVDPDTDRRAFAQRVLALDFALNKALFARHDGRDVDDLVWKAVRPPFSRLGSFAGTLDE